jgi:GDP-L-fucose synthase
MPTNLYGPHDSFNDKNSHVIPGLMQRIHRGKIEKSKSVTAWGTGNPLREFLHVDDLADASVFLLEKYDGDLHMNIGSDEEISIKVLSELISTVVGFKGEINWDGDLPDGTPRKKLDTTKLNELGWHPKITLLDGLMQTYEWFLKNEGEARG